MFGLKETQGQCSTLINVDTISVLPNGDVIISWQPSLDTGIVAYEIWEIDPLTGANVTLDSVGAGIFTYTILASNNNASIKSDQYSIVSDCGSANSGARYYNTIYLDNPTPFIDKCLSKISLNWNAYDDFASGTNVLYKIFVSENSGAYVCVDSTTGTSFDYTGVTNGFTYDIFIRGVENGGIGPFSSSSNIVSAPFDFYIDPALGFTYITTATVVDSQQIKMEFYTDIASEIVEYHIERSINDTISFTEVSVMPAGTTPLIEYLDDDVDANTNIYYYRVYAVNPCGVIRQISNLGGTMLLTTTANKTKTTNVINWNAYEGWLGGVKEYDLYRGSSSVWESVPFVTIPALSVTMAYVDDISNLLMSGGEFCYRVVARENTAAHVGGLLGSSSSSNEDCDFHEPLIYIPNAFNPGGEFNSIFNPKLTFSDPNAYSMIIYDRWGGKVFETQDIYEGWNGSVNNSGQTLKTGVYIYFIKFQSATGNEFERNGTVTILR